MSGERPSPLDPQLAALLRDEALRPEPGAAIKDEVKAALASRIGVPMGPATHSGASDLGAGHGASGAGVPAATATTTTTATTAATSTTAAVAAGIAGAKLVPVALALAVGLGSGAGLHAAWVARQPERVVTRVVIKEVPAKVPLAATPSPTVVAEAPAPGDLAAEPSAPEAPSSGAAPHPRSVRASATPAAHAADDAALVTEAALLQRAQSALARRAPDQAMQALREHELRFVAGQLVEEREALWVQVLMMQGDHAGAARRASDFGRRFPASPQREALERAVEATR